MPLKKCSPQAIDPCTRVVTSVVTDMSESTIEFPSMARGFHEYLVWVILWRAILVATDNFKYLDVLYLINLYNYFDMYDNPQF